MLELWWWDLLLMTSQLTTRTSWNRHSSTLSTSTSRRQQKPMTSQHVVMTSPSESRVSSNIDSIRPTSISIKYILLFLHLVKLDVMSLHYATVRMLVSRLMWTRSTADVVLAAVDFIQLRFITLLSTCVSTFLEYDNYTICLMCLWNLVFYIDWNIFLLSLYRG